MQVILNPAASDVRKWGVLAHATEQERERIMKVNNRIHRELLINIVKQEVARQKAKTKKEQRTWR